ncbi:MAG: ATPase, T2SS/T4P/T4SS family [Gemmatimonadetes bacterium]|nr:ATPase, T2SS/T4P/T4SS family [Gemmatimonadota bacterium]MDA1102171.1 ATPase, T2SS/T4P/T4SS family [Gemmatimonadota bacterium]
MATHRKILGQLLVDTEGVDSTVLLSALGPQRHASERIGETLVRLGETTPEAVGRALALQLGLPYSDAPLVAQRAALDAVQEDLVRAYGLLPLALDGRTIRIAMADPLNRTAVDDVQFQTGRRVQVVVASSRAVLEAICEHYDGNLTDLVDALPDHLKTSVGTVRDAALEEATRRAPVVRLVDRILRSAVGDGASDIHIEETGDDVRIRLRIDGILRQTLDIPAASRRAVLSRIKVISGMDISVKRRPQDGRLQFEHDGRRLTMRVSTLPVNGGEKAVVRILDSESAPRSLDGLGMSTSDLKQLRRLVARGEGVLLSAGPTGSGKSTTLFAALSEIDRDVENVVTLEDPVEYRLPGASQIQVDRRAGMGFAEALRAVLRQDPDVVMIGEIRDRETAEIAMAAAVTGHLVLSTIHTTDAPGAITRLLHMGVPPFLISGGLAGVVAQRLVRRTCTECRGRSCTSCIDGLQGRTGVYQVLTISDAIRDEVTAGGSSARLRRLAAEAGMHTLDSDARRAVASGLTTPHEVARLILAGAPESHPCARCGSGVPLGGLGCPDCGHRRGRQCSCGQLLDRGWRYCPWCIRKAAA